MPLAEFDLHPLTAGLDENLLYVLAYNPLFCDLLFGDVSTMTGYGSGLRCGLGTDNFRKLRVLGSRGWCVRNGYMCNIVFAGMSFIRSWVLLHTPYLPS